MTKRTPKTTTGAAEALRDKEEPAINRRQPHSNRYATHDALFSRVRQAFRDGRHLSDDDIFDASFDGPLADSWPEDLIGFAEVGVPAELTWIARGLVDRLASGDMETVWVEAEFYAGLFRLYADAARDMMAIASAADDPHGLVPPMSSVDRQEVEWKLEPHRELIVELTAGVRAEDFS